MRKTKLIGLLVGGIVGLSFLSGAGVELADASAAIALTVDSPYTDNMVLQRNGCRISGKAGSDSITVKAEGYEPVSVEVENGTWIAELDLETSAMPIDIEISASASEKITLENVLVGEVWYGSGQSNMEMRLDECTGYTGTMLQNADYSALRFLQRENIKSDTPVLSFTESWIAPVNGYQDVKTQSAYATSFALQLAEELKEQEGQTVPVGVVTADWGGTNIEQWLSSAGNREVGSPADENNSVLYNGMACAFKNMKVAGVIWYQGCSNVDRAHFYKAQFQKYVEETRALFDVADLPVIAVQLPQFWGANFDEFRYVQWEMTEDIANAYTAVGIDFGSPLNIHPPEDKYQMAERAVHIAMKYVYKQENAPGLSPYPTQIYKDGNDIVVEVSNNAGLATIYPTELNGFEIKVNGKWVIATGEVVNNQIRLSNGSQATAVRYFHINDEFTFGEEINFVYNAYGLPLAPFSLEVGERMRTVVITTENCAVDVNKELTVADGNGLRFEVLPENGFALDSVLINGEQTSVVDGFVSVDSITINTVINVVCTKIAEAETVAICVQNDEEKGTVIYANNTIEKGGTIAFRVEAKDGYVLENVTVNGVQAVVENGEFVCENVNADITVRVEYKAEKQSSGCSGTIGAGTLIGSLVVFGALGCVLCLKKRKED